MKKNIKYSLSFLSLILILIFLFYYFIKSDNQVSLLDNNNLSKEENDEKKLVNGDNPISTSINSSLISNPDENLSKVRLIPPISTEQDHYSWTVVNLNNEPIANAKVLAVEISEDIVSNWIESEEDPVPNFYETFTDSDGTFDFTDFPNIKYVLCAEKDTYYSEFVFLDLTKERPSCLQIPVNICRTLEGKVINGQGDPIPNAEILAHTFFRGSLDKLSLEKIVEVCIFNKTTVTNNKGYFKLKPFSQRDSIQIYITAEGYLDDTNVFNFMERQSQIIVLKKPYILRGKVTSIEGSPINDVKIYFKYPSGNNLGRSNELLLSDNDGFFCFENAPEGEILLYAIHDEYGNVSKKVYLSEGNRTDTLIQMPNGFDVDVYIKNNNNVHLKGIKCYIDDLTSGCFLGSYFTDEEGHINITSMTSGRRIRLLTIDTENVEYPHTTFNLEIQDDSPIELTLAKSSTLRFEVYDKDTKKPITEFSVARWGSGVDCFYENMGLNALFESTFDSHIIELNVGSGEYFQMELLADGYKPYHIEFCHDPDRQGTEVIPVYLERGISLSGFVVDSVTEDPVTDARISLYVSGNINKLPCFSLKKYRSAVTDSSGYFWIDGLSNEGFVIKVEHYSHASKIVDSYDLADKTQCRIKLDQGFSLQGHVYGQEGHPMESAQVKVFLPGSNDAISTFTHSDGSYYLSGIPAGTHKVSAKNMQTYLTNVDYSSIVKNITFPTDQNSVHDFHFSGDSVIKGICSIESNPVKGIGINVFNSKGTEILYCTDSLFDGFYMIPNIESGDYIIEAYSGTQGCGGSIRKEISLSEGQSKTLDFDLTKESLNGKITDSTGDPLAFADIFLVSTAGLRTYSTTTNRDGSYKFVNLEEDDYFISVRVEKYAAENRGPVLLGGVQTCQTENFGLSPGGVARISVLEKNGHLLRGINVITAEDLNQLPHLSGSTNSFGVCTFKSLPSASFQILLGSSDYCPVFDTFTVTTVDVTDMEYSLEKGGMLRVLVSDKDGTPVRNAKVNFPNLSVGPFGVKSLSNLGYLFPSSNSFQTNNDGLFTISPIPSGRNTVTVTSGRFSKSFSVEIVPGRPSDLNVKTD